MCGCSPSARRDDWRCRRNANQSTSAAPTPKEKSRHNLVRRGRWLSYVTLSYNLLEGIASLVFGTAAGSIALIGFGIDSLVEVTSSVAALWRLRADFDATRREGVERAALRVIGVCFIILAVYITAVACLTLQKREVGIVGYEQAPQKRWGKSDRVRRRQSACGCDGMLKHVESPFQEASLTMGEDQSYAECRAISDATFLALLS